MSYIENIPFTNLGPLQALLDLESADFAVLLAAMEFAEGLATSATLAGLSDVSLTTLSNGQVLTWNGTKWTNENGGGGGSGTVTSVDGSASEGAETVVSGAVAAITTAGTVRGTIPWVTKTGNYSFVDTDRGHAFLSADSGNDIYTLPAPSGSNFQNGWYVYIKNGGTGTIALTPAGSTTIDGQASITLPAKTVVQIECDGTNYHTIAVSPVGNNTANYVFASPNGFTGLPSMRALVLADLPTIPWSSLGNASASLTLANAGYSTTFNQTSAVTWLWANTTAASGGSYPAQGTGATNANSSTSSQTGTSTITLNINVGDWVLVFFHAGGTPSVSDNGSGGGNSYVSNSIGSGIYLYVCEGATVSASSVTVSSAGQTINVVSAATFTGVSAIGNTNDVGGFNASPSVPVTTTNTKSLLVGFTYYETTTSYTATSGSVLTSSTGGGGDFGVLSNLQVLNPSSGAISGTLGASTTWICWAIELQASAPTTPQNSPVLKLAGTYYNGSSSAIDDWTIQVVMGSNLVSNPSSTLTFGHSGTTGALEVQFPANTALSAVILSNGTTGVTQSGFDNSTDLATDAYADNNFKGVSVTGFRDDFLSIDINGPETTTGAIINSDNGPWWVAGIAATSGTNANAAGTFTNPGQFNMTTAATSGDGVVAVKSIAASGTFTPLGALGSNAGWEYNVIFAIPSTASISVRLGLVATAEANVDPPTGGFWVEYDTANTNSNTDWTWRTVSGGTSSYSTTNSKAVDTSFHHVRIRSTVAGTIGFTIDGGTEFTTTTDVSTAVMTPFMQVQTRTTAAKTLTLDFVSYMAATGRT
jgi:hypothetical protein